jgi:hypothetical protein
MRAPGVGAAFAVRGMPTNDVASVRRRIKARNAFVFFIGIWV